MVKSFKLKNTTDYSLLKSNRFNRSVNQKHVDRLIESIKTNGLQVPVIVNKKNEIVDGQHRFIALKKLKYKVPYLVSPNWSDNEDTVQANNIVKDWTALEFAENRAKIGHPDIKQAYEIAVRWNKKTDNKLSIVNGMEILMNGSSSTSIKKHLFNQTYVVNELKGANIFYCLMTLSKYPDSVESPFSARMARAVKRIAYYYGVLDTRVIQEMAKRTQIVLFNNEKEQFEVLKKKYKRFSK
jgi:hypothetical protein